MIDAPQRVLDSAGVRTKLTSNAPVAPDRRLRRCGPLVVAVLTLAAVLLSGHRGLFGARLAEAPGLTLDEGFNVAMGVYLVRSLQQDGLGSLHPDTVKDVYGSPNYNPDHPPLGRWALGFVHECLTDPRAQVAFDEFDARPASAIAYALTVLVIGWFLQKWFGPASGTLAAVCVAILPRQFGHAHLASLETFIGLAYVTCVMVAADRCRPLENSTGWKAFALAGVFFGLALLTKIQAVFLGPAVGLWALTQWRCKAIPRVALFGAVGLLVFFVGWPWLWLDPLGHLKEYFARTTERQTLYCYYWGTRWADAEVPRHYPWVLTAVTVPIALLFLAGWGAFRSCWASGRREPADGAVREGTHQGADAPRSPISFWKIDARIQLMLWAIAIPLLVFSKPGIRIYDGERLFGVVFPLIAGLAGIGAAAVLDRCPGRAARVILALLLAGQAWGLVAMNPFQMSYYNALIGGFAGADRLGFERSYWMEGLTESFQRAIVEKVPRGSRIDVAPVLHPVFLPHLMDVSPILRGANLTLAAYDDKWAGGSKYVLMFHRKADPWASLNPPPEGTKVLAEVRRAGVPLVTLFELPALRPAGEIVVVDKRVRKVQ